jgi:hypothetical protein
MAALSATLSAASLGLDVDDENNNTGGATPLNINKQLPATTCSST